MHQRRSDYIKILQALVKEALKIGKVLKPQVITTEFELAAIQVFNGIQSIMKRLGGKSNYSDDENFKHWANSIFALSLRPLDEQWVLSEKV
jgi:hypothetical protein